MAVCALRWIGFAVLGGTVFALSANRLEAQRWPEKPVRIIVPFGPGGGTGIQARVLTTCSTRTPVKHFVDNRTGASGLIGAELAAGSPPR